MADWARFPRTRHGMAQQPTRCVFQVLADGPLTITWSKLASKRVSHSIAAPPSSLSLCVSWHQRAGSKSYIETYILTYKCMHRHLRITRGANQKKSNGRKQLKLPSLATQSVWSQKGVERVGRRRRVFFRNLCKLKVVTLLGRVHFSWLWLGWDGDGGGTCPRAAGSLDLLI